MSKPKAERDPLLPERGPLLTPRSVVSLVLVVLGLAWLVFYYLGPRPEPGGEGGSPAFMADLGDWNYLIGFGAFFLGLIISAHPSTPLGRGRGVVTGMLGCFLIGLLWICVFYIFSNNGLEDIPIFNDLGQLNLVVGIAFMGVGFAFATRWE